MLTLPAAFDLPAASVKSTEPAPPARRSARLAKLGRLAGTFSHALSRPLVSIPLLLAAVFVAYLPALDAQFLWDDHMLVRDNGLIRSPLFVLEAFRHTLFSGQSNFYRPTQTLVFIADYWLGGNQPYLFHFTSVLIHALNGVALYLLLRRLLPSLASAVGAGERGGGLGSDHPLTAFALSLIWALYPIHSATVDYISGSADSLAMLFCVSAWLAASRCLGAASRLAHIGWGIAAGLALLAGFCSKEIAFVWVVLFALHLFLFSREDKDLRRRKLALGAGALLIFGVYFGLRHIPTVPVMPPNGQQISRGVMALRALGDYGSLLIFPAKLLMERQVYPAPHAVLGAEDVWFYRSLTLGGVLLLGLFAAGAAWRGSGQRLRCFGVCWFMAGFLPVSNLFVTINASVAEHWLYLPSIGFLLFAAGCVRQAPTRRLRVAALGCALLAATAFGVRTYWRAFDWADEFTFYRQTVADGGDVPRARLGFANAYSRRQDDATAIGLLRKVVEDNPTDLAAQANLANALGRLGRRDEVKPILERVFARADKAEPHLFLMILGNLDVLEKDDARWPAVHAAALARQRVLHPDDWELVQYDALIAARDGKPDLALQEVNVYARDHWWHYPSWYLLGRLEADSGHQAQAVADFREASRLDVYDADALSSAAQVCAADGQIATAAVLQGAAVERQPESPRQRLMLSRILQAANRPSESARQLAIAGTLLGKVTPGAP